MTAERQHAASHQHARHTIYPARTCEHTIPNTRSHFEGHSLRISQWVCITLHPIAPRLHPI